jgi:23S rRNA (pseudouridine1915-N3)-methyltransferase
MRLMVAAVGRLKGGPERELLESLPRRVRGAVQARRAEPRRMAGDRRKPGRQRRQRQAGRGRGLLKLAREADAIIALDERGKSLSSDAFAGHLAKVRDGGAKSAAILIGGPDGLAARMREAAQLVLSLGAITLPHGLARIVLAEQLYRAATILVGHPYHRA